ncbi:Cytochrome c oxidase subunit 5A [Actinomortierella ambigua]|uniref:Cytochrome c oxidase subunit 5A n=1 Tax=Actinomortierella ambigua TaxID=1343610 RepID=A0A9P6UBW5_9FUNG|nr:Cytochrome c oxidase subunit 5A [Actinomortierella ambigua]KAG0268085.1 Cytochrome c oxidase subunit 5A [Actinomortierella ambigua]
MLSRVARPAVRAVAQKRFASTASEVPLTNLELRWNRLSAQEQASLSKQLEQLQAGDWSKMTVDQKKAAYWVSFGPHGARAPLTGPNHGLKVFAGTATVLAVTTALFMWIRSKGGERPSTLSKEWQEASNEYARENKINPITGVASEGYKGKGFVDGH